MDNSAYNETFDVLLGTAKAISEMDIVTLISAAGDLYNHCDTDTMRSQLLGLLRARGQQLGEEEFKTVDSICKELTKAERKKQRERTKAEKLYNASNFEAWLDLDSNGHPLSTVSNFSKILTHDPYFSSLKYNALKQTYELHTVDRGNVKIRNFGNSEVACAMLYIEERYDNLYSENRFFYALDAVQGVKLYNPVLDIISGLPGWDGVPRIERFLHTWAGAADSAYCREVSRIIFAGGINRIFNPGCKFDTVAVLLGCQGCGKSTLIRWIAIQDDFFAENTSMTGQIGVEQLNGAWIVEISEMLSVINVAEQESVKAFISRNEDHYRKPYAREVSRIPRNCIFIGSSNKLQFLRDPTGARRFLPVPVKMDGGNLYRHEQECKAYILLCWAEARDKFLNGQMSCNSNEELLNAYLEAQEEATEDDFRIETIRNFLERYRPGERVCVRLLQREALTMNGDIPRDPTRKESADISLIMQKMSDWKRLPKPAYVSPRYGSQRCWEKIKPEPRDSEASNTGGASAAAETERLSGLPF